MDALIILLACLPFLLLALTPFFRDHKSCKPEDDQNG